VPPPPPPPVVEERKPVVLEGVPDDIFFDVNKWVIKHDQEATLKAWIDYMVKHPKSVVDLEGYYDERGTAAWNKTLATNRAEAVKKRFLAAGIYNARITTAIYAGQKFAEGSNEAAWKQNRRTHIVVKE
jgi:outer membrane protein OmpA-like peptidoglycan-associated protein